jgi:hypothetical protein
MLRLVAYREATFVLLCNALVLACDATPPIKTATGERLEGVSVEERFRLSDAVYEASFRGERLRRAVELMDKHGLFAMEEGTYEATGVLDESTVTVVIVSAEKKERRIVVKNCAEKHFCGFADEAKSAGILKKQPMVCRTEKTCSKRQSP